MPTPVVFENQTLYQAQSSTGYQIVFTSPRIIFRVLCVGGISWIRPRYRTEIPGTLPTSPVPANGVAVGWIRLRDGTVASWGSDWTNWKQDSLVHVSFLDIWCESTGDVVVIGQ